MLTNSIYNQMLLLKGLPYMPHLRTKQMVGKAAADIMRPTDAVAEAAQKEMINSWRGAWKGAQSLLEPGSRAGGLRSTAAPARTLGDAWGCGADRGEQESCRSSILSAGAPDLEAS